MNTNYTLLSGIAYVKEVGDYVSLMSQWRHGGGGGGEFIVKHFPQT